MCAAPIKAPPTDPVKQPSLPMRWETDGQILILRNGHVDATTQKVYDLRIRLSILHEQQVEPVSLKGKKIARTTDQRVQQLFHAMIKATKVPLSQASFISVLGASKQVQSCGLRGCSDDISKIPLVEEDHSMFQQVAGKIESKPTVQHTMQEIYQAVFPDQLATDQTCISPLSIPSLSESNEKTHPVAMDDPSEVTSPSPAASNPLVSVLGKDEEIGSADSAIAAKSSPTMGAGPLPAVSSVVEPSRAIEIELEESDDESVASIASKTDKNFSVASQAISSSHKLQNVPKGWRGSALSVYYAFQRESQEQPFLGAVQYAHLQSWNPSWKGMSVDGSALKTAEEALISLASNSDHPNAEAMWKWLKRLRNAAIIHIQEDKEASFRATFAKSGFGDPKNELDFHAYLTHSVSLELIYTLKVFKGKKLALSDLVNRLAKS